MGTYINAAFWLRNRLPLLGDVPVNAIAFAGLLLLGIGHPAFALLALGLEAVYLTALSTNSRFQNVIDARALAAPDEPAPLPEPLDEARQRRFDALHTKTTRLRELYNRSDSSLLTSANLTAVRDIEEVFGRLLAAEQRLRRLHAESDGDELPERIAKVRAEIATALSQRVRRSREGVLDLLIKRQAAGGRRAEALACVDADLLRVENQVDLALEHANLDGRLDALSSKLDLVSYQFASSADNLDEIGDGSLDFLLEKHPAVATDTDLSSGTTESPPRATEQG